MATREEKELLALMMEETDTGEPERDHYNADELLCDILISLGYDEVIEEYKKITRWYS